MAAMEEQRGAPRPEASFDGEADDDLHELTKGLRMPEKPPPPVVVEEVEVPWWHRELQEPAEPEATPWPRYRYERFRHGALAQLRSVTESRPAGASVSMPSKLPPQPLDTSPPMGPGGHLSQQRRERAGRLLEISRHPCKHATLRPPKDRQVVHWPPMPQLRDYREPPALETFFPQEDSSASREDPLDMAPLPEFLASSQSQHARALRDAFATSGERFGLYTFEAPAAIDWKDYCDRGRFAADGVVGPISVQGASGRRIVAATCGSELQWTLGPRREAQARRQESQPT